MLSTLIVLVVNFNIFIEPLWGFILSVVLLFAVNASVWQLAVFLCRKYLRHKEAGDWIGAALIIMLGLYGYGILFFPSWISQSQSELKDPGWMTAMRSLFQKLYVAGLVLLPAACYFIASKKTGRVFLNMFLLCTVVIITLNRARSYYTSYTSFVPKENIDPAMNGQASASGPQPDIYYFLLDGYTGNTALTNYWHFDNGKFSQEMRSLGFRVSDSARTHIAATIGVMSAVFNFSGFEHPHLYAHNMDLTTYTRIRNNRLMTLLKKNGYEVSNNSLFFEKKPFFFSQGEIHPWTTPFSNIITRNFVFRVCMKAGKQVTGNHYEEVDWLYDYDGRIDKAVQEQIKNPVDHTPRFCYNHLMITHPSYRYTKNGEKRVIKSANDKDAYIDQVEYTNHVCSGYFNALVEKYRHAGKPLLIIAQSDHGSKELGEVNEDRQIQLMVYDSQDKIELAVEEDGVNLMRKVAGAYLNYFLPDQPYEYFNIFSTGN